MAVARTVVARDAATVVDMYTDRGVKAFALWQQNEMLWPCVPDSIEEGAQILEKYLNWLDDSKSAAIYTLKVYHGIRDEEQLNNSTKHNGGINFRLHENSMAIGGADGNAGYFHRFTEEMAKMNGRIDDLVKSREEDEGDGQLGGWLGAVLNPEFLAQIPAVIGTIKGLLQPSAEPVHVPESDHIGATSGKSMTEQEKITYSLEVIRKHAPDIADLLMNLASMAERKPFVFKSYLTIIRAMKG